jgi:hypothetical protein
MFRPDDRVAGAVLNGGDRFVVFPLDKLLRSQRIFLSLYFEFYKRLCAMPPSIAE